MAADSEGKSDWRLEWEAKQRKEFQEDPAMWLRRQYEWITDRIDRQGEWQVNEAKSFVQNAAEVHEKEVVTVRDSLIWWVSVIAMAALASAGVWIGVAAVGVLAVLKAWFNWSARKQENHLQHFRDRFRELLKKTDDREMLAEDKEFLRKHADSILFPLAVANTDANSVMSQFSKDAAYIGHGRETTSAHDLEHIQTLYLEHCHSHFHVPKEAGEEDCKLCDAARSVREHIESAISKYDAAITSARKSLTIQIDGSNPDGAISTKEFLEHLPYWDGPLDARPELRALIQWLRDKDRWTFEQAHKVLDACQADNVLRPEEVHESLMRAMESAAARCGQQEEWKRYSKMRQLYRHRELDIYRRVLRRRNPEAMFGEIEEDIFFLARLGWPGSRFNTPREGLQAWGYNYTVAEREVRAAKKLMTKHPGEQAKCYERELAAARNSAWVDNFVREQRYKEFNAAVDNDFRREEKTPLASRMRRAFAGWLRL